MHFDGRPLCCVWGGNTMTSAAAEPESLPDPEFLERAITDILVTLSEVNADLTNLLLQSRCHGSVSEQLSREQQILTTMLDLLDLHRELLDHVCLIPNHKLRPVVLNGLRRIASMIDVHFSNKDVTLGLRRTEKLSH